ncbi:MAG TPA: polysaccharide deacetylase family protein [Aggregatilineales bacterium]|nr:polysaccharide deacetylase family protein [Aggregatilineales bacterium]
MRNALTIDLEEWYHPEAIRQSGITVERHSQVIEATTPLLDLLARYNINATFFTVGEVAETHPKLIEHILQGGHELAFHGWTHDPLWVLTPESFTSEIERFLQWRDSHFPGVMIRGFRAPTFSLDHSTIWAIRILQKHGFVYDSSVFPARTPLYGVPDAPLAPYCMDADNPAQESHDGLFEIPMSVYPMGKMKIGFTGGLYLRALPLRLIRHMIQRTNAQNRAAMLYIHPWETYPGTPRLKMLSRWQRFVLYQGLPSFAKLEKLLDAFQFDSIAQIYFPSNP